MGHKAKADVANCPAGDLASRFSKYLKSTNFKSLNVNHFFAPLSQRDSSEKGKNVERSVVTASGVYAAAGNLRYFLRTLAPKK